MRLSFSFKIKKAMSKYIIQTVLFGCSLFLVSLITSCSGEGDSLAAELSENGSGVGGSFARFMVVGDFMYTVDNERIKTLDISNPADPSEINVQEIATGIESIFRLGERLFIGSSTGLFLYTIGTDGIPQKQGEFLYSNFDFPIFPCDPVVANDSVAFVSLNTAILVEGCRRDVPVSVNTLNLFDVKDIQNPVLISQHEMLDPQGVGIDGDLLFLCENDFGLRIFDISDPYNFEEIDFLEEVNAHDVIPLDGLLLIVGKDNVYQVDYTDRENIQVISTIPVGA